MRESSIKVMIGGERLYVFPYSVDRMTKFHKLPIVYLVDSEQTPYACEDVLNWEEANFGWYVPLWQRLWYAVFKRMLVAMWRAWINRSWFSIELHAAVPFRATSYPQIRLGLQNQLIVEDPGRCTDTVYLVPSQDWIRLQLEARLVPGGYPTHWDSDVQYYQTWKEEQVRLGREVRYLVSMDT
jgi:hypothetical protein